MKLEDIKKKNIHSVPDKYFDQLPMRIQSRVDEKKPVLGLSLNWNLAFKVGIPAIAMVFILFYFGLSTNGSIQGVDEILAQVSTNDIIAYLETTDITTDEILEELDFTQIELEFYDETPILQDIEMDEADIHSLMDKYGIENETL